MTTQHFFIATLLCSACFIATAQDDVVKEQLEGPSAFCEGDLRDFQHMFEAPVGPSKVKQHVESGDVAINFKDRITNMPEYLHNFISQYEEAAQTVLNGGTSWLSDPTLAEYTPTSGGIFFFLLDEISSSARFSFTPGSDKETIQQIAVDTATIYINKEYDILKSFMPYAYLAVNYDHPEVFWIGNSYQYGYDSSISVSYNYAGEGTVYYKMRLMFYLHAGSFDIRNNGMVGYDYRNPSDLANGVELYNTSVHNILEHCQSKSRYRKLRRAYDWLTTHNCYNYYHHMGYQINRLGGMPWSPLSALEGNTGQQAPVCEGYARAMKVLCDSLDIPCILVPGNSHQTPTADGVSHMWNYVQMEDGNWYAVDPTWDDPYIDGINRAVSGYEAHNWFLLGSTTDVGDGFTFIESHPEQWFENYKSNGSYNWELLPGPELAAQSWVAPDAYDPSGDSITDMEDINLMAEKIINDDDDIEDIDGNDRITIGDLVLIIKRYLSE